jgi:hypothetical protein
VASAPPVGDSADQRGCPPVSWAHAAGTAGRGNPPVGACPRARVVLWGSVGFGWPAILADELERFCAVSVGKGPLTGVAPGVGGHVGPAGAAPPRAAAVGDKPWSAGVPPVVACWRGAPLAGMP